MIRIFFSIVKYHIEIIYKAIIPAVHEIMINNSKKLFMDHVSYYLQCLPFIFICNGTVRARNKCNMSAAAESGTISNLAIITTLHFLSFLQK